MKQKWGIQILIGIVAVATPFLMVADDRPAQTEKFVLDVEGMKDSSDPKMIQSELKRNSGVLSTDCNQASGICRIEIDPEKVNKEDVAVMINKLGFQAFLKESS
jgi:Glu-tRNA(Gln) amidotransferase subunit E-like FAD-binding protein